MAKSKRTKVTEIPKKVKLIVNERDGGCCLECGKPVTWHESCCHIIPRSKSGRGVEKNIITLCVECHYKMDHTANRELMIAKAKRYIESIYGTVDWNSLIYKKGEDYE